MELPPLFVFFCAFRSLFCDAVLIVLFSFSIISLRKEELVALLQFCSCCRVAVNGLYLFPEMPWFGVWSLIVVFPSHTHMHFCVSFHSTNTCRMSQ